MCSNNSGDSVSPDAGVVELLVAASKPGSLGIDALASLPYSEMTADQLVEVVGLLEAQAGWLASVRNTVLCTLRDKVASDPPPEPLRTKNWDKQWEREKIAAVAHLSGWDARVRIETALALRDRLPATAKALAAGQISDRHAQVLAAETAPLPERLAAEVEQQILADPRRISATQFRNCARVLTAALQPAVPMLETALARETRFLRAWLNGDGSGSLSGRLPSADLAVIAAAIDGLATPWGPDDLRGADQRRADALLELATSGPQPDGDQPDDGDKQNADDQQDDTAGDAHAAPGASSAGEALEPSPDHAGLRRRRSRSPAGPFGQAAIVVTVPHDALIPPRTAAELGIALTPRHEAPGHGAPGHDETGQGAPGHDELGQEADPPVIPGAGSRDVADGSGSVTSDDADSAPSFQPGLEPAPTINGQPIDMATLQRLSCDSLLWRIITDAATGQPLNARWHARTPSPAQRRALHVRDNGACSFPGCTRRGNLHAHHITHHSICGPTTLENLTLLCSRHHHAVHDAHWTPTRQPNGDLEWRTPAGKSVRPCPADWEPRPDPVWPEPAPGCPGSSPENISPRANPHNPARPSAGGRLIWGISATSPSGETSAASGASPTDPANPVSPTDPANPADPANPVSPADLADPATPASPANTCSLPNPASPTNAPNSGGPADPATPSNPASPANPANPAGRTRPASWRDRKSRRKRKPRDRSWSSLPGDPPF